MLDLKKINETPCTDSTAALAQGIKTDLARSDCQPHGCDPAHAGTLESPMESA